MALKAGVKGLYNLGQLGASNAIKSNFAKKKTSGMIDKYIGQALKWYFHFRCIKQIRSFSSWWPNWFLQWYPISMYSSQGVYDPTNPSYEGLDIHKVIGKLSIPKSGSHFLDIST